MWMTVHMYYVLIMNKFAWDEMKINLQQLINNFNNFHLHCEKGLKISGISEHNDVTKLQWTFYDGWSMSVFSTCYFRKAACISA